MVLTLPCSLAGTGHTQMSPPGPCPRGTLSPASKAERDMEPGGDMNSNEDITGTVGAQRGQREALEGDEVDLIQPMAFRKGFLEIRP